VRAGEKSRSGAQPRGELGGNFRAAGGVATLDGGDDEARSGTRAQLLDQQALVGARATRKKGRKIGAVVSPCGDHAGEQREQQPQKRRRPRGAHHGLNSGPRVRSELSPSRSRISTVWIASPLPARRTERTLRATAGSTGSSSSVQEARLPEKRG